MEKKKKAYLLGDMLKLGSQRQRTFEKDQINELGTIELYSAQDQKDINDKSKNPTAEAIFAKDADAILHSEIIVADCDNDSVGSTCEIGMIWGINYVLKRLKHAMQIAENNTDTEDDYNFAISKSVEDILHEIPEKKVYWHSTDIRNTEISEQGMRRSFSINQFLYGCLLDVSGEQKKFEEILSELKEI